MDFKKSTGSLKYLALLTLKHLTSLLVIFLGYLRTENYLQSKNTHGTHFYQRTIGSYMHNRDATTHANTKDNIVTRQSINYSIVPRISSRQQSSLIGDVESAPPTVSALHAATMESQHLFHREKKRKEKELSPRVRFYRIRKLTGFSNGSCVLRITVPRNVARVNSSSSRVLIQDAFRANGWDFRKIKVGDERERGMEGGREGDYLTNI